MFSFYLVKTSWAIQNRHYLNSFIWFLKYNCVQVYLYLLVPFSQRETINKHLVLKNKTFTYEQLNTVHYLGRNSCRGNYWCKWHISSTECVLYNSSVSNLDFLILIIVWCLYKIIFFPVKYRKYKLKYFRIKVCNVCNSFQMTNDSGKNVYECYEKILGQ